MTTPPSHISRAKDPAIVAESQNIRWTIGKAFWILVIVLALWGIRSCISSSKANAEAKADPANCEDKAGKWVTTPAGSYRRAGDGKCVTGTPPPPPQSAPPPPPAVESEGDTPCTLPVGWDRQIKSGDKPVLVRFHGKTEWIRLSGRGNDKFTLDQFSPGNADFASPEEDEEPVHVQIFPVR